MSNPLKAPAGVVAELRRGLAWHEAGQSGDGLKPQTVREARALASGTPISRDKAVRMRAWLARHAVDKEGEGFHPGEPGYPSPGRVAWALWGGDPAVAWSARAVKHYEENDMEKRTYTAAQRREMAASGAAMPDGAFPIMDAADLRAAMRSIGRAADPEAARRHIRRRAKKLGLTDMLTDAFKKGRYYDEMGIYVPWDLTNDPPDLPIPCTPADLTPTMIAAMPEAMQSEFCARFNALASPIPTGAGMPDDGAFHCALMLCRDYGGWLQRPDGSWFRIEVTGGDWNYEEDEGDMEKAGRVLSAANRAQIVAAVDALNAVLNADATAPTEKAAPPIGQIRVGILKAAEQSDEQVCYGYAYVATDAAGKPVTDHSGDVVDIPSLRKAVMDSHGKIGMKIMHKGAAAARIVGSIWADHDMLKAIGADPADAPHDGWLIAVKVDDADLWKRIKSGEISAFSIGGKGTRTPIS